MSKPNPGWFRKGHDPRRHQLTTADRRKGFRNAAAGAGVGLLAWLRNRAATTSRPATVDAYKRRWLAQRCEF